MLGSVAYVAPEVVRGEEPTPASDRYSVGATLFHCLTGDVVFPRGSDAAVLYAHAAEAPPLVHERRNELPEEVDQVMERLCQNSRRSDHRVHAQSWKRSETRWDLALAGIGPPPFVGQAERLPAAALPSVPAARRPAVRLALVAGALLAAAAVGVGVATLLDSDPQAPAEETSLEPVPAGAIALGSDLAIPQRSVDCRGNTPGPDSPSCSIVQSGLDDATLLIPEDGVIVGWDVRGADGELALDVIRPRGSETLRVSQSQWESAGNPGPHHFETRLAVEGGDQIGLQLGPGSVIGITEASGATTQRWLEPFGGAYGEPDLPEGSGMDYEIALRASFVPGERIPLPPYLTGERAAAGPDGKVRESDGVRVDTPQPTRLQIELVEVGNRVALDVLKKDRRTLRMFIPDLVPNGLPTKLELTSVPGEPTVGIGVWWVNPNTGRSIYHGYLVTAESVEYAA